VSFLLGLLLLVLGGAFLHYRRATQSPDDRWRVVTSSAVVAALMLLTPVVNLLGF
jgi:hypothetical protein